MVSPRREKLGDTYLDAFVLGLEADTDTVEAGVNLTPTSGDKEACAMTGEDRGYRELGRV